MVTRCDCFFCQRNLLIGRQFHDIDTSAHLAEDTFVLGPLTRRNRVKSALTLQYRHFIVIKQLIDSLYSVVFLVLIGIETSLTTAALSYYCVLELLCCFALVRHDVSTCVVTLIE